MSRLGKKPIVIPEKTTVEMSGNELVVKGPLGELRRVFRPIISIKVANGQITTEPLSKSIESKALWGTYSSHINNMIKGVNAAFVKKLVIEGIGFKAEVKGQQMLMALGFSHPVNVPIPAQLKVTVEKGIVTVAGADKEMVGQFAARVRALKKPEPYKGKGIRYEDEVIRRKQGKKTA